MPNRSSKPKRPSDINQLAKFIVEEATGQRPKSEPPKNPAAVALGRLGGMKGGPARAAALSKKRRKAIAKKAARTRWNKQATNLES